MDILIVDDEILVRMGLKTIFAGSEDGFRLIEASNGKQAMELYALHKPPLVLVDITMPVMDGLAFITESKKLGHKTQYVILTCHDEFDMARQAIKLGVSDYIVKTSINEKEILEIARNRQKEYQEEVIGKISERELPDEFIKGNLLRNIILGKVNEREMLDVLLEKYNMQFMQKPLAILVFIYKKPQALEIFHEMLGEYLGGMTMELDHERALALLALPQDTPEDEQIGFIEEYCERVIKSVEMYFNFELSIGVCICYKPEDLSKSVKKAERALHKRFYFEKPGFSYSEKSTVTHIPAEKLEEHRDSIVQCLQNMEYSQALTKLENFISLLVTARPENVYDIRLVFTQVYYTFSQHLNKYYSDYDDDVIRRFRDCGRFSGEEGLFEFFRIFRDILEKMNSFLNRDMKSYHSKIIIKAKQYIHDHLNEDTDLDSISRSVNLSPTYFSELFKQKTGQKFIDFITEVKMEKAQELLQKGEKVYSIMEKLGYNNHSYFCRLFKKVTGKSLRELRRDS